MTNYSESFKESLVRKVLTSKDKTMSAIARETNISVSTLHGWVQKLQKTIQSTSESVDSSKKPLVWTSEQRFNILLDTHSLSDEALNQY